MGIWSLRNKYILIVDDFPGMRTMLRNMLTPFRPEHIIEAKTGEEAIEAIKENDFDIILCDYNLGPGKDGQEVLEEIKERDLLPYSSLYIMVTAENTAEMVMGVVEYAPDDYLSKPFTKDVLISRLQKLLKRKSNLKHLSAAKQQGDFESVIKYCDEKLADTPTNRLELLKIKIESLIKINNFELAESLLLQTLKEREIPWALLLLGQTHYHQGHFDQSREIFKDLVGSYPNYLLGHDWLAKVYEKSENFLKMQEILEQASEKSPKAIRRQQLLAQVSFNNADYDTSEKSYKRITKLGKHSYFTGPDDFLGLANVYIKKGMVSDALDTISDMTKEYSDKNPVITMKSLVNKTLLFSTLKKEKETNKSLDKVISKFSENQAVLNSLDAANLAKVCYSLDRHEDGNRFIEYAIKNNHDDKNRIDEIIQDLKNSGLSKDDISRLLKSRDEVIEINNRGVKLATSGNIADSISLFMEAANEMPENKAINLNTAQSLIMYMKESGASTDLLQKTKSYLDKVQFPGVPSEKYQILASSYRDLASRHKAVKR